MAPSILVLGAAVIFLLLGLLALLQLFRGAPPVADIPLAHETFYERNKQEYEPPMPPAASPAPRALDRLEPVNEADLEIHALDLQIRELSLKINKATVMLGTGQLSQEGYRRYTDEVKSEKADLEAKRVRLEMRQHLAARGIGATSSPTSSTATRVVASEAPAHR